MQKVRIVQKREREREEKRALIEKKKHNRSNQKIRQLNSNDSPLTIIRHVSITYG